MYEYIKYLSVKDYYFMKNIKLRLKIIYLKQKSQPSINILWHKRISKMILLELVK